jgi:hypothetical protein
VGNGSKQEWGNTFSTLLGANFGAVRYVRTSKLVMLVECVGRAWLSYFLRDVGRASEDAAYIYKSRDAYITVINSGGS